MQQVDLATAVDLTLAGLADEHVVPLIDKRLDRMACQWRRGDNRQVAQARHGHIERARDRCRSERQDVDLGTQCLQPFLVPDAKAMLLVDDDESQVFESDALAQQLVGADHDVDLALFEALEYLVGFLG